MPKAAKSKIETRFTLIVGERSVEQRKVGDSQSE